MSCHLTPFLLLRTSVRPLACMRTSTFKAGFRSPSFVFFSCLGLFVFCAYYSFDLLAPSKRAKPSEPKGLQVFHCFSAGALGACIRRANEDADVQLVGPTLLVAAF